MSKLTAIVITPNRDETMWKVDVFKDGILFYTVYYGNQDAADAYAASINKDN